MLLELDGLPRPIAFVGCDDVARDLARVTRGWRMREGGGRSREGPLIDAPLITVEKSSRGVSPGIALARPVGRL